MTRKPLILAGASVAVVLGVVASLALPGLLAPSVDEEVVAPPPETARVERGDVAVTAEVEGWLGYGDPRPLVAQGSGTVTWLPEVGTALTAGSVAWRIDERPVPVFVGETPLYRAIGAVPAADAPPSDAGQEAGAVPGADPADADSPSAAPPTAPPTIVATGRDAEMAAQNLVDLGYLSATVQARPGAFLAEAIRIMQRDLGLPVTGRLDPGDVVVLPTAARVADVLGAVGTATGAEMLAVTDQGASVTVDATPRDLGQVQAGAAVTVIAPDGTEHGGSVTSVGTEYARSDEDGGPAGGGGAQPSVRVVVALADAAAFAGIDTAPVRVRFTTQTRQGVLWVPATALVALAEGGYAVQRPDGALTGVDIGLHADDRVELVGGDVVEGDELVVAR